MVEDADAARVRALLCRLGVTANYAGFAQTAYAVSLAAGQPERLLLVILLQLYLPGFPPALSVWLAPFQHWIGIPSTLLLRLMNLRLALAASAFAPFLFVPFGRRQKG